MFEPTQRSHRVKKAITRTRASPRTAMRTIHGLQVTGWPAGVGAGVGVGGGASVARWVSRFAVSGFVVSVFVIGDENAPMESLSRRPSKILSGASCRACRAFFRFYLFILAVS